MVGYGVHTKSDLTGSISSIKPADITSTPTTNALKSLQGKVAGFDITQSLSLIHISGIGVEADLILFHPYDGGRWGFDRMPLEAGVRYLKYLTARMLSLIHIYVLTPIKTW